MTTDQGKKQTKAKEEPQSTNQGKEEHQSTKPITRTDP